MGNAVAFKLSLHETAPVDLNHSMDGGKALSTEGDVCGDIDE